MGSNDDNLNEVDSLRLKVALDLYENAPCGSVSFQNDGLIIDINNTLTNWLGYKKEEIVNVRTLPSLFKIGGQIFFETHFFPLIKMQGFIKEVYFDILRKDKTVFHGLINVREIPLQINSQTTYQATILDVTDRWHYENELLDAKRKAEADSKAKADFLATISHEIRTPLNAILGIGNLLHKTPLNDNQKEYARLLLSSSENLLSLVNNLLDLSKIEAKKLELEHVSFNLLDLLTVLKQIYSVKAEEKGVELLINLDEGIPNNIIGDPVKLNQILTNLIGNAIKFTKVGAITVSISLIKKFKKEVHLKFEVSDTGIGIPEEKLETIFQEFSQASYDVSVEYGGTGLGLTISKKLLELHDSQLVVTSKVNEGSKFSFSLKYDVNKQKSKKLEQLIPTTEDNNFEGCLVLVVDDNLINIYITTQYLDLWNIKYKTAKSGREAIDIIKKHAIDIVLLDLQMPKMNGYETAEKIRELKLVKEPAIIAFSASTKGEVSDKLINAGIDDHLPKPFQPSELLDLLGVCHSKKDNAKKSVKLSSKAKFVPKKKGKILSTKTRSTGVDSYSLERYIKMANNKPEYLKKFVLSTLDAMVNYQKEFEIALANKNEKEISDLIHKTTMTMYYMKADPLSGFMGECRELLGADTLDEATLASKGKLCMDEFTKIIKGLKKSQKL